LSEPYGDFDSRAWGDVRDTHVPLLVDIDHAVDPLFQHTDPAVTHMRSIVVVAEEDHAADEAPGAIRRRV